MKIHAARKNIKKLIIAIIVGLLIAGGGCFAILVATACKDSDCLLQRPINGGDYCNHHSCLVCTKYADRHYFYCLDHTCAESDCFFSTMSDSGYCILHIDENNNQNDLTDTSIVGVWRGVTFGFELQEGEGFAAPSTTYSLNLKDDGTFTSNEDSGTYETKGNAIIMYYEDKPTETLTFLIPKNNPNILILSSQNFYLESKQGTIIKISELLERIQ
jgi:hypothetical protein